MNAFRKYRPVAGGHTSLSIPQRNTGLSSVSFNRRKSPTILLRRLVHNAADDPNFVSIVDNPQRLVRSGKKHGSGLILLGSFVMHHGEFGG